MGFENYKFRQWFVKIKVKNWERKDVGKKMWRVTAHKINDIRKNRKAQNKCRENAQVRKKMFWGKSQVWKKMFRGKDWVRKKMFWGLAQEWKKIFRGKD